MYRIPSWLLFMIVMAISVDSATTSLAQNDWSAESVEYFERHVRPLLLENCVGCHSQAINKTKGGLSMDSRASLVAGGDSGPAIDEQSPEKSLLLEAVRRESLEMPPNRPLSSQQVAILEKWLKMGAPWPNHPKVANHGEGWLAARAAEHWSWRPLVRPSVPQVQADWPQTPLDAFIYHQLQSQGLQPSPPAARHELIRRLFVDIIGLPPTQEQLQQLSPDQNITTLVDQLLASPQYGVHWGRHWLDLMRYAETLGHEFDYPIRNAWRYRDAVINAFNDDLPYDQLLAEHIAGDLVKQPRIHPTTGVNESLASTAWWWLGDSVHAPVDVKNDWATRTENQVDVFSKTFLGMTVACARCHDHKFDAIGVSDYYGLVGVAQSIRRRYAITDPHHKIAQHRNSLREQIDAAQATVKESWRATPEGNIRLWLEQTIAGWRALPYEELNKVLPIGSPLYPLRLLVEKPPAEVDAEAHFAKRFSELRSEVDLAVTNFEKWQSESVSLGEFSLGLPKDWRLEAVQPEDWQNPPSIDWFDGASALPALPNTWSSKNWGRWQPATLRSPRFQLSHRCVCLKIRGKSTQSSVCVNGYFMNEVHGLLFGDTRKAINQPDDWGWVVHAGDLNKYIGDPTFISLETSGGDAWFEIAEARLADRGPPAQPHAAAVALLQANPASRAAFVELTIKQLYQSLLACSDTVSDRATTEPPALFHRANDAAIARAVLRQAPDIVLGDAAASNIQSIASKLHDLEKSTPAATILLACEEGDPIDAAIELRGNPHQLGDPTPRGCFHSLVPWPTVQTNSSGRQELVQSLTDRKHPLVSRVIVNRVWFYLLGRGLVNSPDNFGVLGSRPTHPELLDYLAGQFIEHGWSMKWLVREIVLSQTYQLSSLPLPQHAELDAEASQYSHRIVRRLDAEVLRDAIMLIGDSLEMRLSEASVPVHLTEQMTGRGRPGNSGPLDGNNRRSMFIEVRRNFLNPFLMAFDFPMPSTTTGKRNVSNVPAQALGLLNDPLVTEMCQRWVAHTASISNSRQRIAHMITAAFSRPAREAEIDNCLGFVKESGDSGWIDLAHTLINAKEFWYLK
jgi:Protein of unknown function (DUF1553)/Protein of unknown function (DUF1549)/Planctomycete cytochrome C